MSNFISGSSDLYLGTVNSSGTFENLNKDKAHGDVCAKIKFKFDGGTDYDTYLLEDSAVIYHRVDILRRDDDDLNVDVGANFTIAPWQFQKDGNVFSGHSGHVQPIYNTNQQEIYQNRFGNYLEFGYKIGTLYKQENTIQAKLRTYTKDFSDHSIFRKNTFGGTSAVGSTPSGFSGQCKVVYNSASGNTAIATYGTPTAYGSFDSPIEQNGYWREVKVTGTLPTFRHWQINFQIMANSQSLPYRLGTSSNSTLLQNVPEYNDYVNFQYKFGDGDWITAKQIARYDATHWQPGEIVNINQFYSYKIRISQTTQERLVPQFRWVQKVSHNSSTVDHWIIDNIVFKTVGDTIENETSGASEHGVVKYTRNTHTLYPLWKWDTSLNNIYFANNTLPAEFEADNTHFFSLKGGTVQRAVFAFKAASEDLTTVTGTNIAMEPISQNVARAAKFSISVSDGTTSDEIIYEKNPLVLYDEDVGLAADHARHGEWQQKDGKQLVKFDLSSYYTPDEFWESKTFTVTLKAYGKRRNGTAFLVDETSFTGSYQPYVFTMTNTQHIGYITFPSPGTDSSLVGIYNLYVSASEPAAKAFEYFGGVYNSTYGWNTQQDGNTYIESKWTLSGFDGDGLPKLGSQTILGGLKWYRPNSAINYYGSAGQAPSNQSVGLNYYPRAYKKSVNGYTTSASYVIDYKNINLKATLRKGWQFHTGGNAVLNVLTGNFGGMFITHDNVSTWSLSKIVLGTPNIDSKAHWFDVIFAYSRDGGTTFTTGTTNRFTGTIANLPVNDDTGIGYRFTINNPISNAVLNSYFPSIYDDENYKLSITVKALNNLEGVIDTANTIVNLKPLAREAADLLNTSNITFGTQESTRNTQHAPYLYPTYRIAATDGTTYTGKAAYVRLDIFDENDNSLGNFFNTGFQNSQNNTKTSGWIKATGFSDYLTKVANNTATDYIRLSNGLHNTSFANKTFKFILRILADDGGFIDSETKNKEFTAFTGPDITAITPTSNYSATTDCKVVVAEAAGTRYDYATIRFKNTDTDAAVTYTTATNGNGHYHASSATNRSFTVDENNSNLSIASIINDGGWTNTPIECKVIIFAYGYQYDGDPGAVDNLIATFTHQAFTYIFNNVTLSTDKNTHSEHHLKFQWKAGDKDFHKAGRFRIRLRDSSGTTYTNTSANLRKEFYVAGSSGTTSTITRTVDVNQAKLDIADMLNNSATSRYSSHTIAYDIQAQRQDGDIWVNIPYAVASGTFARPALQWNHKTASTSVTIHSDTYNETKLKIRVYRNSSADTIPLIRFGIEAHTYMTGTGTVPHEQWQYEYFTTTVLNTEGNSLYEDFYYTIPSALDRTKIKEFRYDIRGGYGTSSDFTAVGNTKVAYITASTGWNPYWKFGSSTSLSLGTNTIDDKFADVNIRGAYTSTAAWKTPSKFGLTFRKLDSTGTNIIHTDTERELLFSSSNPNSNTVVPYRIKSYYDGNTTARSRATEAHYFQVVIKSYDANNNVMQTMTRAIIMPADPLLATTLSTSSGCILADNGTEHLYLRFVNSITPASFKVSGHDYNLNVKVKDGEDTVTDYNVSIDISDVGNYYNLTVPTGVNVNTQDTTSGTYTVEVTPSYYLDYNSSQVVTGSTLTDTVQFEKIHHTFPKAENFENLGHTYEGTDGKLLFSFGKRNNGVQTGYSSQHEGFNFNISATETVTGALEFNKLTPNPPSPLPNNTVSGITDVTQIENGIPWTSYYPNEANYKSTLTVSIEEKYDNANQTWWAVATGNTGISLDIQNYNTSAPTFSTNVSLDTKVFTSPDTTMNDLSNYPNTTVVPTNIVVTDIAGEYAAPYKRFTFNVPIDFDAYFTNAEPFFSFGLEVEYKDSNNNTHTSGPSYITDQGNLIKASEFSGLGSEKIGQMQESSVYKVRDFGQENDLYYFDLKLNQDGFDYAAQPSFNSSNRRNAQYTLLVYIRDEVEVYGQDKKILTEPVAYSDIGNWTKSVVKGNDETPDPDDWYADGTIAIWEPVYSNFNVQPQTNDKTKFDYSFNFDIDDIKKKPYAFSQMNPRWRGAVKTLGGASIATNFYSPSSYHYDGGEIGPDTYDLSMSLLDKVAFNPFEDITFSFVPYMVMNTKVKNSYLYGWYKTIDDLTIYHTLNYRDLIVPSFDSLSVDHSLNEDTINNNNTLFTNKLVFFFNKDKLKDVIKVFSLSEEWITMRRNILQDGQTLTDGEYLRIYPWGASVSRESHDANTNKITYTDGASGGIDLTKYNGLDGDKPFVFEYELTPTFRYRASNTSSSTYTELPEKKISTFLIPDEFPYANNGVSGLASKSIHEDKHSIHLKWNHQYTESLDTFRSVGAKIFFDLYWYVDETDAQKTVKEELKPKRRKLERIVENQNIASSWNFIDTVEYVYPSSPVTNGNYEFSYLWKYDKLETDTKMIVAVITRIESEVFGVLSQSVGTVGNNSIEIGVVKTSDKAKKSKLHNDDELKRTPNKIIKRKEEFNTSLEQLPISTTRKKAKPRGSDKPYSSST